MYAAKVPYLLAFLTTSTQKWLGGDDSNYKILEAELRILKCLERRVDRVLVLGRLRPSHRIAEQLFDYAFLARRFPRQNLA
jgi:hypothetical protein